MERLTERLGNNVINVKYASQHETAIHRLATIEDILGDEYDLDLVQELIQAYREGRYIILKEPEQAGVSRLRELAQADREGRCMVLPCKVGELVYFALLGRVIEKSVFSVVSFSNSQRIYCNGTIEYFRPEDVGKTVFLTREEAEAVLRREQE